MSKIIAPECEWSHLLAQLRSVVPEAFNSEGHVLNLIEGTWGWPGHGKHYSTPIDGTELGRMPMIDLETAKRAVRFAAREHETWARTDLDERRRRVRETVDGLRQHRDLIAYLLMWEIGKPYHLACDDVDRCLDGVEWYIDQIEWMLSNRQPLGLISNIASWNYPYSVLVHAVLVQALAGNAVIAKTPSDGGLFALTLGLRLPSGWPACLAGQWIGWCAQRCSGTECRCSVSGVCRREN